MFEYFSVLFFRELLIDWYLGVNILLFSPDVSVTVKLVAVFYFLMIMLLGFLGVDSDLILSEFYLLSRDFFSEFPSGILNFIFLSPSIGEP